MIDFTTIQTFPTAPTLLKELSEANSKLQSDNARLSTAVKLILVVSCCCVIYHIYKINQIEKENKNNPDDHQEQ